VAFVQSDPDPIHFRLVAAVAEHEEEFLTGIDREHPEKRADVRLDPEKIVKYKIERYFAVHGMKVLIGGAQDGGLETLNIC
jgi:hypothetical protein